MIPLPGISHTSCDWEPAQPVMTRQLWHALNRDCARAASLVAGNDLSMALLTKLA